MEGIYPLTVTLTKKEAIMRKVKLIVHETYQGKRKSEDVFAAVFPDNTRGRFYVLISKDGVEGHKGTVLASPKQKNK